MNPLPGTKENTFPMPSLHTSFIAAFHIFSQSNLNKSISALINSTPYQSVNMERAVSDKASGKLIPWLHARTNGQMTSFIDCATISFTHRKPARIDQWIRKRLGSHTWLDNFGVWKCVPVYIPYQSSHNWIVRTKPDISVHPVCTLCQQLYTLLKLDKIHTTTMTHALAGPIESFIDQLDVTILSAANLY